MTESQSRSEKTAKGKSSGRGAGMSVPSFNAEEIATINHRNMEAAARMGQAMFDGMTTMNQEFLKFLNTRIQADLQTARSLAECRNPSDFLDAELRFLQTCVQHYAENTNRLLDITAEVVRHGIHDVEDVVSDISKSQEKSRAA